MDRTSRSTNSIRSSSITTARSIGTAFGDSVRPRAKTLPPRYSPSLGVDSNEYLQVSQPGRGCWRSPIG